MGAPCLVPEMVPFPLSDSMGMMTTAAILNRSLDPGTTGERVQWDTFQGAQLGNWALETWLGRMNEIECGSLVWLLTLFGSQDL